MILPLYSKINLMDLTDTKSIIISDYAKTNNIACNYLK